MSAPDNLDKLCDDLGIGLKRRAKLVAEHGEEIIPVLQKLWVWTRSQDQPRLMGKRTGYTHLPSRAIGSSDRHNPGNLREEAEAVHPAA